MMRLNKPIRTPGERKEFKVYVKNPVTGNINTVRFGDTKMRLLAHIRERREAYCARSENLSERGDRTSANYWSRKRWKCEDP